MKNTAFLKLIALALIGLVAPCAELNAQTNEQPVLVYGIAAKERCGGMQDVAFRNRMTTSRDYVAVKRELKAEMEKQNANAEVRVGSSLDYGSSASAIAIAQITMTRYSCNPTMYIIEFGRTPTEALERAKKRNILNNPFELIEQKYFVRVNTVN